MHANIGIPTFLRCVQMISGDVARMPISVLDKVNNTIEHSVDLLWDGSGLLTKYDMIRQLVQSTLLHGNGYLYIDRAEDGTAVGLRWLPSYRVSIAYNEARGTLYYLCSDVSANAIEPVNMVHLKFFTADGVNGKSVGAVFDEALELIHETNDSAHSYFGNKCNLNGIINVAGALNDEQTKGIKKSWREVYTGEGGGIAVLQGNMTYQPISSNAKDSQMLESREAGVVEVCRMFGINPVLLGVNSGAKYSTFEAAMREYVNRTLMFYVVMLEEELNRKLFTPSDRRRGLHVDLNENSLLRADKSAESSYYNTLVSGGILTTNEARHELGYQPMEGGDDLRVAWSDANQNKLSGDNSEGDQPEDNQ